MPAKKPPKAPLSLDNLDRLPRVDRERIFQLIQAEKAVARARDLESRGWRAWYSEMFDIPPSEEHPDGVPFVSRLAAHHAEAIEWHWNSVVLKRAGLDIKEYAYFAIWPRGHMKCCSGDTEVLMADGTRRLIKNVQAGELLQSFDEVTGKIVKGRVIAQWRAGQKRCVRVKTRTGRELVATPDHKVRTFDGWKKIGDLLPTDRIASPRKTLTSYVDHPIPDEELRLLVYFMAEGHTSSGAADITNADAVIVKDIYVCATALGFTAKKGAGKFKTLLSGGVRPWLRRWGLAGKKSTEKRWPVELNQLSPRQLRLVLAAWLDTDGFISTQSAGINLANEALIDDLRYLCLQAGIVTKKYYLPRAGFGSWVIEFDHHAISRLASLPLLLKQANWSSLLSTARYSLIDAYPGKVALNLPKGENRRLRREIGWKPGCKNVRITRNKIQRAMKCSANPQWEWLEQADVFWDEVTFIEEAGLRETYDLEVAGTHNFIAEGLVTHNSTIARYIAITDACLSVTGYCLYVSGTKNKVRGHAISIESLLSSSKILEYYPALQQVKEGLAGQSKGWTRDFIYTKAGYVFHFISLDEGIAGANIDTVRPTLIIPDDVDDREASAVISENRMRVLTRAVLPTRQHNTLVFWAQNLINRHTVLYAIWTGKQRVLALRANTQPVPAFLNLEVQLQTHNGIPRDVIISGTPTWPWYDLKRAQEEIDNIGLDAFLSECQHDVDQDRADAVVPEYDDSVHIITWDEFNALYRLPVHNRDVPRHWRRYVGHDWGSSGAEAGHANVVGWVSVAAANSPLPGTAFCYHVKSFPGSTLAGTVARAILNYTLWHTQSDPARYIDLALLDRGTADPADILATRARAKVIAELDQLESYSMWHMSHEAKAVRDIYRMVYGLAFQPCNPKKDGGVAQLRHYLRTDYTQPHPFRADRNGLSRMYFIVENSQQRDAPTDDSGMKLVREQLPEWRYRPPTLTSGGYLDERPMKVNDDVGNMLMMIFTHFRLYATPLNESEQLVAAMPANLRYESLLADSPYERGLTPEQELAHLMAVKEARTKVQQDVEAFDDWGELVR
jgi:hypothetical protein